MARRKRCTLCGGKLLPSGICKECGWDNSKNDDGYRLNTHNEAGMKLHTGDCEDVLNRENPHKQIPNGQESASEAGKTDTARSRTAKASAGGTRSQSARTSARDIRTQTEKTSAGGTHSQSAKTSAKDTRTQTEKMSAGDARSLTKKKLSGDRRRQKADQPVRKKHTFLK